MKKTILLMTAMTLLAACSINHKEASGYNDRGTTTVIDRSQPGYTYYGFAMSHIAYDDNLWQILRKDETKKDDEKYLYPDGDKGFIFNWADRYNYKYSVTKGGE